MPKIYHMPIRMCLSCRERDIQNNLLRLHCKDGELSSFSGVGRSFYLCSTCLKDDKRLSKVFMRQCRNNERVKHMNKLKEIITDDR